MIHILCIISSLLWSLNRQFHEKFDPFLGQNTLQTVPGGSLMGTPKSFCKIFHFHKDVIEYMDTALVCQRSRCNYILYCTVHSNI